jgi:HEPN domain-containing protein
VKESPLRKEVICRWMEKALDDLEIAEEILPNHPGGSTFHSQQAAEKALKALLIAIGMRPPKTHRIELLLELLEREGIKTDEIRHSKPENLSDYAVEARYPDFEEEPTEEEAHEALKIAREVVEWAQNELRKRGIEC